MKKKVIKVLSMICIMAILAISFALSFENIAQNIASATVEDNEQIITTEPRYARIDWNVDNPESMSTEGLVERLFDYPNLDYWMILYDPQIAFKYISSEFNGFNELIERADLVDAVRIVSERRLSTLTMGERLIINLLVEPVYTYYPVTTMLGHTVTAYKCISDFSSTDMTNINNGFAAEFPFAILLRDATAMYNCHSYAWYNRSATNDIGIPYPSYFKTDGYSITTAWAAGDIVVFHDTWSNEDSHSAVIASTDGTVDGTIVISKWGKGGLYQHNLLDCPYTDNPYTITVYRACPHTNCTATSLGSSTHRIICNSCGYTYDQSHTMHCTSVNSTSHLWYCSICSYSYADLHNINPRTGRCYDCGFKGSGISPNSSSTISGN